MPTTRRRRLYRLLGSGLTADQRQHLECGHAFFLNGDPFASEDERQATWARHRRQILKDWDRPGRRPEAYWRYDAPDLLAAHDDYEATAIHAALADAREKRLIELQWLDNLRIAALHAAAPEHVADVAASFGIPTWFADRHAPSAIAELARDRGPRGVVIRLPTADVDAVP